MGRSGFVQHRVRLALVIGLSAGLFAGCSTATSTTTETEPEPQVAVASAEPTGRPRQMFASLADLVRGSDAIVVGTIVSVRPGRAAGDVRDGAEGQVQFFDVVVQIDERLVGPRDSGEITIEVLFLAGIRGSLFSIESSWWRPEASSVFFLNLDAGIPGREATLVNSQGLYFLPDGIDGTTAVTGPDSIREAVGLTVREFGALIADVNE
ncbi:hypothetical protein BMS3Bbin02_01911 [bacterium BMS3Bbin02]|nr:hypothetical protein BMS3Bbin02_01911 [bacterium BMS3Bbin02]